MNEYELISSKIKVCESHHGIIFTEYESGLLSAEDEQGFVDCRDRTSIDFEEFIFDILFKKRLIMNILRDESHGLYFTFPCVRYSNDLQLISGRSEAMTHTSKEQAEAFARGFNDGVDMCSNDNLSVIVLPDKNFSPPSNFNKIKREIVNFMKETLEQRS